MALSSYEVVGSGYSASEQQKSLEKAYLFWLLCGAAGLHRFYLGRVYSGAAMLILTIAGCVAFASGFGPRLMLLSGMWMLLDAVLIPGIFRRRNSAAGTQ